MMSSTPQPVREIAFLYVAAAIEPDGNLSDRELARIQDVLIARGIGDREVLHDEVVAALGAFPRESDTRSMMINRIASNLREVLSEEQREGVLHDLTLIARADGVVLEQERAFIDALAGAWGVDAPPMGQLMDSQRAISDTWDPYHDLALIYLVLAHGTDNELSQSEVNIMLKKLREWQPNLTEERTREILRAAMERYAMGPDDQSIYDAIRSVRRSMPTEKRKAALQDLVQIANADGVFLDNEEDLINNLVAEWDVDPYVTYGRHGDKT